METPLHHEDEDSLTLHKLGYAQVLYREMGGFSNFAISFTIISILAGCLTSYFIAFNNGGPVAITWGWLIVGGFVTLVALAMAEVASAMPTAGAIYYWSSKLGSPVWGWFSGWFNLIGQIAVTAAIDYGAAIFWTALLNLWFPSYGTDTHMVFLTFSVIVALHLLLNLNGVRLLAGINTLSAWWHMAGVAVIVGVLIFVPAHHQSATFVFTKTINASGFGGHDFSTPVFWFVFGIGLLMAQYTYTGYDASAHMSEETKKASRAAAMGVLMSVVMSVIFGWILLLAVTFAVPDVTGTVNAGAFDVTYIWQTSMGKSWAEFLLLIACVAQFFCGLASLTAASRMMFAFSRDGAVPGRELWRKVSRVNRVPVNAVIAIAVLAWALMLPTLWNGAIGYLVGTSVAVIGLYIAYGMPIYLRWRAGSSFEPGAWTLGKHYRWINPIAVLWIVFVVILFLMPTVPTGIPWHSGFDWNVVNYAPITVGGVLLAVGIWWFASAKKWFQGPVVQGSELELEQIEAEYDSAAGIAPASAYDRPRYRIGGSRHTPAPSTKEGIGVLTLEELRSDSSIDTVIMAFTDMQGRLLGKRLHRDFFLEQVEHDHGTEGCNYLLALDMEMEPTPGYEIASWERGYGDFDLRPDLSTLRRLPWLEATALVLCDVAWADGTPVRPSPRQVLRAQVERARELGYEVMVGSELEFYLLRETFEEAHRKGYRDLTPSVPYILDYHILATSYDEPLLRQIRNGMQGAGIRVETSKGEAWPGQQEINFRYSDALTMADNHAIYKNGAKEIAFLNGCSLTFMAKPDHTWIGSSCHIHSSLWRDGSAAFAGGGSVFESYLAGQIACARELAVFFAPNINSYKRFAAGSWAPTTLAWGMDNRTCGFRIVGSGLAMRVESRIPGGDVNPYLAFAATIASGLYGLENSLSLPPAFEGNAYESDVERFPSTLREAIGALENGSVARAAFGDDVVDHYLNYARTEQELFDRVVTNWERERLYERG